MRPYRVQRGDYLAKIAHRYRISPAELWNAPENRRLKELRKDPNILAPNDVVYVPDEPPAPLPLSRGEENRYVAEVPEVTVKMRLQEYGQVLKPEPYVVDGLATPIEGELQPGGILQFDVPLDVKEVRVTLCARGVAFPVLIGYLDPIDTSSGVIARLTNLGFYGTPMDDILGESDGRDEPALARAIGWFQGEQRLPETGIMDAATRDALLAAHGS